MPGATSSVLAPVNSHAFVLIHEMALNIQCPTVPPMPNDQVDWKMEMSSTWAPTMQL